jgi:iron complex transport system ATP-binding protein
MHQVADTLSQATEDAAQTGRTRLAVSGLDYSYGSCKALEDIYVQVNDHEFVGIIGPNGSGKSTLLKNIYRALDPDKGTILLDGEDLHTMSYRQSAVKLGVVGQENEIPFDFSVEEIVSMGRSPHKRYFEVDTVRDREIVHHALSHLGIADMAQRSYRSLSGGEKQRVIIARVIAQQAQFLVLDEPTNHLDISYQLQIFGFVRALGVSVLAAIHDLGSAALYCDRLYAMQKGKIMFSGSPREVLTPENIRKLFGVDAEVTLHPRTGRLHIAYLPVRKGVDITHFQS